MQTWDIRSLDVEPHAPQVLQSESEGRTIVIALPAGEQLQEHQVHERAWIFVASGEVEIVSADGAKTLAPQGAISLANPKERHEVRAVSDARLVLVLAPWPGDGHPSQA